jgi:hypothetical protein
MKDSNAEISQLTELPAARNKEEESALNQLLPM